MPLGDIDRVSVCAALQTFCWGFEQGEWCHRHRFVPQNLNLPTKSNGSKALMKPWMVQLLRCIWFVFSRLCDVVMSGCACRIWNNNSDLPGSSQCLLTQMPCADILNIDKVNYSLPIKLRKKKGDEGAAYSAVIKFASQHCEHLTWGSAHFPASLSSQKCRTKPGIWSLLLPIPFKLPWWQGKISLLSPIGLMTLCGSWVGVHVLRSPGKVCYHALNSAACGYLFPPPDGFGKMIQFSFFLYVVLLLYKMICLRYGCMVPYCFHKCAFHLFLRSYVSHKGET